MDAARRIMDHGIMDWIELSGSGSLFASHAVLDDGILRSNADDKGNNASGT